MERGGSAGLARGPFLSNSVLGNKHVTILVPVPQPWWPATELLQ